MVDNRSVDRICSRIREDGEKEVNSILQKATETASEIIEKAEQEKDKVTGEIIAEAEKKGEAERRRELSGVQIEIKRAKLKIREDVINNVMENVKESLRKVRDKSDYPEILKDMIVEGIKALDGKSFLVMVDRADFSIMEKEVLPAVRDELKGELEDVRIRQLEEDSLGGVKVGTPGGNVVYDNRFEARMYRLRDDIRNMIYEDIFRSEGGEG